MAVQALGYLGISTEKLDEWSDFATRQIGLQLVDKTASSRAFRMDDRRQRIIVDKEHPDSERFFGWEVADATSLDALAGNLEGARVAVRREPASLADRGLFATSFHFVIPPATGLRRSMGRRGPPRLSCQAVASPVFEPVRRAWDMSSSWSRISSLHWPSTGTCWAFVSATTCTRPEPVSCM